MTAPTSPRYQLRSLGDAHGVWDRLDERFVVLYADRARAADEVARMNASGGAR